MWQLLQYRSAYDDLYRQCGEELKATIDQRLYRLRSLGNAARSPVSRKVGDGVFECRADAKRVHARLLYFFQPGKRIIIAIGVLKDQRRLPRKVIEKAEKIRATLLAQPELMDGLTEIH